MDKFVKNCSIEADREALSEWHNNPAAFKRIQPPWEKACIIKKAEKIKDGLEEHIEIRIGPLKKIWIARYHDVIEGKQFCDLQIKGPFAHWDHHHIFHDGEKNNTSILEDNISYKPPMGFIGRMANNSIRKKLERMFDYRHKVTKGDLERYREEVEPVNILVTGGTGLVGSDLIPLLRMRGHRVFVLTRKPSAQDHILWNPDKGEIDGDKLSKIETVIHLAGANIAKPWTKKYKAKIRDSRVKGTEFLVAQLLKYAPKLTTFLSASGSSCYPLDTGEFYDESGPMGNSFLGEVCIGWEAAAQPLRDKGIRVANFRIGLVISRKGGALQQMLPAASLCLTGPWSKGTQHLSWIAIDDLTDLFTMAVSDERYQGVINAVAPNSVSSNDFFKTLGKVIKRPQIMRAPAFVLKMLPGNMAEEIFLADNRVQPAFLEKIGYKYRFAELEEAIRHETGRPQDLG